MRLFDFYGSELTIGKIVFYEGREAKITAFSAPERPHPQGLVTVVLNGELRPLNILPSEIGAAFGSPPEG